MQDIISLITTYEFIWRAFFAGLMIALCASLLGVTIVLKRLSMIGDGLSHVSFGGVAAGAVFGVAPLKIAIPLAAICSVILFKLSSKKMKGDSGIAVISTGALAIGIIMISLSGSSADMNNYLIGSLYSVTKGDMALCIVVCFAVIASFVFLYNRFFAVTFDEDFAKATGVKTQVHTAVIAVLTSVVVVLGMQVMGALLISALLVFPSLSAMRVFKSFFGVTICSAIISVFGFVTGFVLTLVFDSVPTGACIAVTYLVVFMVFSTFSYIKKKVK